MPMTQSLLGKCLTQYLISSRFYNLCYDVAYIVIGSFEEKQSFKFYFTFSSLWSKRLNKDEFVDLQWLQP